MKKIIFINILVFLILFAILEFISYLFIKKNNESYVKPYNEMAKQRGIPLLSHRYAPVKVFNQKNFENRYRHGYKGHKKYSIVFFGCSYTYGNGVAENESLPYKVGQMADVTTINRGISGISILNSLYDMQSEEFDKYMQDKPIPKYIVYLFINDHLDRISNPYKISVLWPEIGYYEVNPDYTFKNGELKIKNPSKLKLLSYAFFTKKAYHYFYSQRFAKKTADERMFELLEAAKKITNEKYPNSKFVVLLYKDGGHYNMSEELADKLKENGFIVLDSEELAGHELENEKWRAMDKEHPNGKAFEDVAKGLVKALKL